MASGTEKLFQALSELTRRAPWRSENEERWVESLLRDAEAEIRPNTTLPVDHAQHEVAVIGPPPGDGPVASNPATPAGAIDYDLLAQAIVRAQAAQVPPAEPPPAPAGAVVAPPDWVPPVSPDIPAASVHAGAAEAAAGAT